MVIQSNGCCVSLSGLGPSKINMALFLTHSRAAGFESGNVHYENPARCQYVSQIQHTGVCQQSNSKTDTLLTRSVHKTSKEISLSVICCNKLWAAPKYQITKNLVLVFLLESYVYVFMCWVTIIPHGLSWGPLKSTNAFMGIFWRTTAAGLHSSLEDRCL